MLLLSIIRRVLLSFVPLALFYLLKKASQQKPKGSSRRTHFDKSQIVEGEIVEEE